MKNKLITFLVLLISSYPLFSQNEEFRLKELNDLREQKIITEEDYQILKREITGEGENREGLYDLSINSKLVSKMYRVIEKEGKLYFPLKEFFEYIGFANYKLEKKI